MHSLSEGGWKLLSPGRPEADLQPRRPPEKHKPHEQGLCAFSGSSTDSLSSGFLTPLVTSVVCGLYC